MKFHEKAKHMNDAAQFEQVFSRLTGYAPFRWQSRLYAEWLSQGRIPSACGVPTGLGKTSIMALWLIAKASGVGLPRRLIYVVDRRAVVDQATRFAETLRGNAARALGIAELPVSTLRGQFVDNREWLADPAGLAIIVGTVDMIGSRLLFSGYGVSRGMRPFHAGLLGVDSLVLLDEAHLCPPFETLLRAVATEQGLAPVDHERRAVVPGFHLLPLSATGRADDERVFSLEKSDVDPAQDPVAAERFTAAKHVALHEPSEEQKLEDVLATYAWQYGAENQSARVLVYCDQRTVAVKVKEKLDRLLKDQKRTDASQLLVGARRVHERQSLQAWLEGHGFLGGSEGSSRERPVFLVATAAGEVGVDLDADYMVCDLVPWERIVQRLGRVNRRGGDGRRAYVDIILTSSKNDEDVARLQACWAVLQSLPRINGDRYDASLAALKSLRDRARDDPALRDLQQGALSKEPLRPALTRPLIEAWSLTSLDEHTGRPSIEPWLRGWVDDEPQVKVAWRQWLPWREDDQAPLPEDAERYLALAPVHLDEILEAPTHLVLQVLAERAKEILRRPLEHGITAQRARGKQALLAFNEMGRFKEGMTVGQLSDLGEMKSIEKKKQFDRLHGHTLVVAAGFGGLTLDGMLDRQAGHVSALDNDWTEDLRKRVGYYPAGPGLEEPDTHAWKSVGTVALRRPETTDAVTSRLIRFYVVRQKGASRAGDQAVASRAQHLDEHHAWAAEAAREIAANLGLSSRHAEMLVAATANHDLGKQRLLWQIAMNAPADGPYAKTPGGGDGRRLNGYRHEFGSLRDVLRGNALAHLDDESRDLAAHLIAAHHGFAHPTVPAFDPEAPVVERDALAHEVVLRFARLQRLWGPWGLAWWEALLRAADSKASKRLDVEGRN